MDLISLFEGTGSSGGGVLKAGTLARVVFNPGIPASSKTNEVTMI